jgi:uncharacterized protein YecT (DUF1311 family)
MSFVLTSARHSTTQGASARQQLFAIVVVISALLFVLPAQGANAANALGQTQMQLNEEACGEYKKADAEMNWAFGLIMRNYRGNQSFVSAMRRAQLAWLRYRDAQLESIFPGDARKYGSINPMCRCMQLAEITKARTQILNRWVEGIEEGDVCSGSVKVK